MKTIIVTDLDGTLLPNSKIISPIDLAAIDRLRAAGGQFTIATGRTLQAATTYISTLCPDLPCILFNGAVIYDANTKTICDQVALSAQALSITQTVLDRFPDISAEILTFDTTYVARLTPYEEEHLAICGVTPVLADPEEIPIEKWIKVLFTIDPVKMPELVAFFATQSWDMFDFVQSEKRFFEMLPKGATKGTALTKLANRYKKNDTRIIAVGDFNNDLEMLRAADIAACPSNAQPCVKEIAQIILNQSCESGAIAELIDRCLLI